MLKPITGKDLFDFGQCNHRVYLNTHGDESLKQKLDPAQERLMEDGVLHERAVIADYELEEVTAPTQEERIALTQKLMEEGTELIYHGLLKTANFKAEPDILKKVDIPSKFGSHSYIPVEIKSAKTPRFEHLLQLYFYAHVLELLQEVRPEELFIINAEREWIKVRYGEVEAQEINAALSVVEKISAEQWTSGPTLVSHCKKCPWQKHCLEYMKLNEDVSLIHKLGKTDKFRLHDVGIKTLSDIAGIDIVELEERVETISGKRLARYRIQAEAMKKGEEILLKAPSFPQADLEVHLDLEIESSYDACYLFGLLLDDGKKQTFTPIFADKPEGEEEAWNRFVDFLEKLPDNTPIYHWAMFEPMWLRKLANKYGISNKADVVISESLIDLHKITETSVAFPLSSYSLKDVARHLGFDWRDAEIGGALSMLWYLEWLESGEQSKKDQILRYNEDDVRATKWVKDWLIKVSAKQSSE